MNTYPQQLTQRRQKTRQIFINALVRLVIERGYDQITVTDIANEANYGRWAFYQYFDSKEAVVWATFEEWMGQLDRRVVEAVAHLASPQREYESWRILIGAFQQQLPFFARLGSIAESVWRVRAKELLVGQFLHHLQAGQFTLMEGVRPEIAARLYVAAFMELLETWVAHPDIGDANALVDEFFTFIFNQPPTP
jgi:AcrR family transcriptional regulator